MVSKTNASHWPILSGSNNRPSFGATTSKPCSLPISVRMRSASPACRLASDHGVLKSRALGEEEHFLAGALGLGQEAAHRPGTQPARTRGQQPLTTIEVRPHHLDLLQSHDRAREYGSPFLLPEPRFERNQAEGESVEISIVLR